MSVVSDFLFGGTDTSSQDATLKAQDARTQQFGQLAQQARGDVVPLIGQSQADANLGFQSAIDALVGGRPQFQNAILGLPAQLPSINLPAGQEAAQSLPPQVNLPQFGGSAAVFPEQQVGFQPPPGTTTPQGLTLADAQRAVFDNKKGTDARRTAQAQVNQLLASGPGTSPLAQALAQFQGLRKGSGARGRAKQEVRDLLQQGNLQTALQGLFGDVAGDPGSIANIDLSTLSLDDLNVAMNMSKGIGFTMPGASIPSFFVQNFLQDEINTRGTFGGEESSGFGGGENEAGDPAGNVA